MFLQRKNKMSSKDKEPTWNRLPKRIGKKEKYLDFSQRVKWLCATAEAPVWKMEEYLAQHDAWKEYDEWRLSGISRLARG